MKKLFIVAMMLSASVAGFAQQVKTQEPEFIGSYCVLTSDSTYDVLPKESGKVRSIRASYPSSPRLQVQRVTWGLLVDSLVQVQVACLDWRRG